jgi:hypothetical protein
MGTWLSKMLNTLVVQSATQQEARQTLLAAQAVGVQLSLELTDHARANILLTTIQQVRDEDFIINQATIGGAAHPLTFGEAVKIGFVLDSRYHSGETRCLGRIKIRMAQPAHPGASDSVMYGYRLAIPNSIRAEDRRTEPRAQLGFDQPIEAHLYAPAAAHGAILGHLLDISMLGARVLATPMRPPLEPGGFLYLKVMLPEPGGLLDEMVNVARVDNDPRGGACTITVRFQRRIESLERLMRGERHAA